jgi:hypothetical protein
MKPGDVIKENGIWGVVEKIDGSYAHFRYQNHLEWRPFSYGGPNATHEYGTIDLLEYYKYDDPCLYKYILCYIHRFCEDIWDQVTYDGETVMATILTISVLSFILGLLIYLTVGI